MRFRNLHCEASLGIKLNLHIYKPTKYPEIGLNVWVGGVKTQFSYALDLGLGPSQIKMNYKFARLGNSSLS